MPLVSRVRRERGACLTLEAQASTVLKEREEHQVVLDYLVSPVALVSLVPLPPPLQWVLWEILVCLVWTENLVSRAPPVPLVPPAQAPLRGIEVTPVSLGSLELRARKESLVTLEVQDCPAALGSKEREESLATAEVLV